MVNKKYSWKRKYLWGFEKKKLRKIRRRIFEHGKYDFRGGEGGKYLEKEDIFCG